MSISLQLKIFTQKFIYTICIFIACEAELAVWYYSRIETNQVTTERLLPLGCVL